MKSFTSAALASTLLLSSALALPGPARLTTDLEPRSNAKIISTCTKPKTFAMTFDDGPYIYEKQVVSDLAKYGAKGTFFVNGNNYDCIYNEGIAEQLQKTYQAGHVIGSHTWDHVDITTISAAQLEAELDKVEAALKKILGIKPRLFRPPYGSYNQAQLNVLAKRGYQSVVWSFDSGDSTGSTTSQSESAYKTLAKDYPTPQIALNHETYSTTVKTVAPYALQLMHSKGYKLVSVADCLGISPYQEVYTPSNKLPKRDSTWHC